MPLIKIANSQTCIQKGLISTVKQKESIPCFSILKTNFILSSMYGYKDLLTNRSGVRNFPMEGCCAIKDGSKKKRRLNLYNYKPEMHWIEFHKHFVLNNCSKSI